ncbi:hypothetical protein ABZ490_24245 [Streptomyces sp. NPDC005811]|uniref:hypothetical protein n=1 Tax=Streptomyces sp. NPDC005811 TaxID=3154565 RepID=UPI00340CD215
MSAEAEPEPRTFIACLFELTPAFLVEPTMPEVRVHAAMTRDALVTYAQKHRLDLLGPEFRQRGTPPGSDLEYRVLVIVAARTPSGGPSARPASRTAPAARSTLPNGSSRASPRRPELAREPPATHTATGHRRATGTGGAPTPAGIGAFRLSGQSYRYMSAGEELREEGE